MACKLCNKKVNWGAYPDHPSYSREAPNDRLPNAVIIEMKEIVTGLEPGDLICDDCFHNILYPLMEERYKYDREGYSCLMEDKPK